MTRISVGEFKADPEQAITLAESGVTVEVTRDGRVVAELMGKGAPSGFDERAAALDRIERLIDAGGLPFGKRFSYEERTS